MSTFLDLYRARSGETAKQDENFLVAATGFLINTMPDAASAILRVLHEAPTGPVACSGQQALVHHRSGQSVGRTDLTIRWCDGNRVRSLIVEAKLDSVVDLEQLSRYADGVGPNARVALVSRRTPPALPQGVTGYTWDSVGTALAGR